MMERDDPAGARILRDGDIETLRLLEETMPSALVKEKWVSAFEFSKMIPSPSSVSGGSTIGNTVAHRLARRHGQAERACVGEAAISRELRRERLGERAAQAAGGVVDDPDARRPGARR